MYFSYDLNPGVRVLPGAVDDFLSRRRWFRSHMQGGEVVVNGVERREDGFLVSVTITYCGETFTLEECD